MSSPYASPIICVKKPDRSVRLCLDTGRINSTIVPMRDSSPLLDEILVSFICKKYFSSGYWQIVLHPSVHKYVSFV